MILANMALCLLQFQMVMAETTVFTLIKPLPLYLVLMINMLKSGATVTVTGSGFATPANATAQIKVSNQSYNIVSVDSDTQLKFTVGAGNFRDYIIVTDKAGNKNLPDNSSLLIILLPW